MNNLPFLLQTITPLIPILNNITKAGGITYLVGGSVRDLILGCPIKDMDFEVHNLTLQQLETTLKKHGSVMLVGKQFGVLRIAGIDVDWSAPRADSSGRKPQVIIQPDMTIQDACRRRDLTMNAMAIDMNEIIKKPPLTTQRSLEKYIIDPYDGLKDIKNKHLSAVDEKLFIQDPLRFYRVMQFIGRFEMEPNEALNALCARMDLCDPNTQAPLAQERVHEEIKKLLLKSTHPSWGFRWLARIGRLNETFPELQTLVGIKQKKIYHPEGDVFEHTMQALDAAARLDVAEDEKYMIMLGILCHDLGKAITTDTDLSTHGHEEAGIPIARNLVRRLTNDQRLQKAVCVLVKYHMLPFAFVEQKASDKAYKRLATKLGLDVTLRHLVLLSLADYQGRNGNSHEPTSTGQDLFEKFMHNAEHATVAHGPEAPVLLGRHLLDIVPPGPKLGTLLKKAYQIQIDEGITDVEELKRRVLKQ